MAVLMESWPVLAVSVVLQIIFMFIGFRDLVPRPAAEVRGGKVLWGILIALPLAGIGTLMYLAVGRKQAEAA